MKLTTVERLILINQYLVLEQLFSEERETYQRIRTALENGYESEYRQALMCIDEEGLSESKCRFVQDVLGMHLSMAWAYEDSADKAKFTYGEPTFLGFDGNNEPTYLGYARYLIDQPKHYNALKSDRGYNSHCRMVQRYVDMLAQYNQSSDPQSLTPDDVNRIIAR